MTPSQRVVRNLNISEANYLDKGRRKPTDNQGTYSGYSAQVGGHRVRTNAGNVIVVRSDTNGGFARGQRVPIIRNGGQAGRIVGPGA